MTPSFNIASPRPAPPRVASRRPTCDAAPRAAPLLCASQRNARYKGAQHAKDVQLSRRPSLSFATPIHREGRGVTYSEISRLSGTGEMISPTLNMPPHPERDHNAVWVPVRPKIGLRRLKDNEIAKRLPEWFLPAPANKLRRGGDQANVVELKELDLKEQASFSVDCIQRSLPCSLYQRPHVQSWKRLRAKLEQSASFMPLKAINLTPQRPK